MLKILDCLFKKILFDRVEAHSELISSIIWNWNNSIVEQTPLTGDADKDWSMLDRIIEDSFSPLNCRIKVLDFQFVDVH